MSAATDTLQERTNGDTPTREMIGRVAYTQPLWRQTVVKTTDATQVDYAFWDKLRYGVAEGYQFGALFCKPVVEIVASWVLGQGVALQLQTKGDPTNEADPVTYTNTLLSRWWNRVHARMTDMLIDLYALGDQYVVVNADGSLATLSPETADVEHDPEDPHVMRAVTFTTKLDEYTVADAYTLEQRTITRVRTKTSGQTVAMHGREQMQEYPNLIDRLPVVHFANDRGVNEIYGRPIYEALLGAFARYDDLLVKMADGAEILGNPIPTFRGMEDIDAVVNASDTEETEEYTDKDGNTVERTLIRFDRNPVFFIGKGGALELVSPNPAFPDAVRSVLKALFLLVLDHTRIPEFMWGGAIASSKASAETQLPPFVRYIEGRQRQLAGVGADEVLEAEAQGGILELADIWLRTRALADPRVVVGPVTATWPDLAETDEALRLEWVKLLAGLGYIREETAVQQADIVDDPAAEVQAAHDQADEQSSMFEDWQAAEVERLMRSSEGDEDQEGENLGED